MTGVQNFQSLREIALTFKAFTISNKLYQFVARRGEGNFDPSLARKLSLYSAAVNLELEFGGDIQEFTSKLKQPGFEQSYKNLFSSDTVNFHKIFIHL